MSFNLPMTRFVDVGEHRGAQPSRHLAGVVNGPKAAPETHPLPGGHVGHDLTVRPDGDAAHVCPAGLCDVLSVLCVSNGATNRNEMVA